jgi:hypothetical protein
MEWGALAAAIITAVFSFLGVYISNRKSAALMEYRMCQVESSLNNLGKKVDKHNTFDRRLVAVETKLNIMHKEDNNES